MTFAPADLLLTDEVQGELTQALTNAGMVQPLEQCIAEAQAVVTDYTAAYSIADDRERGWVRAIALWKAFTISGQGKVADAYQKSYDLAMEELKDVRDGKFALAPSAVAPEPEQVGTWGGTTRISLRTDE